MATPIPTPKGFKRLDAFPLDSAAVFNDETALDNYISETNNGNNTGYDGQYVSVSAGVNETKFYRLKRDDSSSDLYKEEFSICTAYDIIGEPDAFAPDGDYSLTRVNISDSSISVLEPANLDEGCVTNLTVTNIGPSSASVLWATEYGWQNGIAINNLDSNSVYCFRIINVGSYYVVLPLSNLETSLQDSNSSSSSSESLSTLSEDSSPSSFSPQSSDSSESSEDSSPSSFSPQSSDSSESGGVPIGSSSSSSGIPVTACQTDYINTFGTIPVHYNEYMNRDLCWHTTWVSSLNRLCVIFSYEVPTTGDYTFSTSYSSENDDPITANVETSMWISDSTDFTNIIAENDGYIDDYACIGCDTPLNLSSGQTIYIAVGHTDPDFAPSGAGEAWFLFNIVDHQQAACINTPTTIDSTISGSALDRTFGVFCRDSRYVAAFGCEALCFRAVPSNNQELDFSINYLWRVDGTEDPVYIFASKSSDFSGYTAGEHGINPRIVYCSLAGDENYFALIPEDVYLNGGDMPYSEVATNCYPQDPHDCGYGGSCDGGYDIPLYSGGYQYAYLCDDAQEVYYYSSNGVIFEYQSDIDGYINVNVNSLGYGHTLYVAISDDRGFYYEITNDTSEYPSLNVGVSYGTTYYIIVMYFDHYYYGDSIPNDQFEISIYEE